MLDPKVDLFCQIFGVVIVEEVSFVQGKALGGRPGRIGNHRDQPAADRLQTADRFDLDFGRMAVKVRVIDHTHQLFSAVKLDVRRHDPQTFCVLFNTLLKRPGSRKDQADLVTMAAFLNAFQQQIVGFFPRKSANEQDHKFAVVFGRPLRWLLFKDFVYAVGHNNPRRFVPDHLFKCVADELCGIMNEIDIAIKMPINIAVKCAVRKPYVDQRDMTGKVFCLAVESGRDRNAHLAGDLHAGGPQGKRKNHMHHVRPLKRFAYD